MRNVSRLLAMTCVLAGAMSLSGCVTLLPKSKPVQLYRFAYDAQKLEKDALPDRPDTAPVAVAFGMVEFPQDSAGDRVTTVEGSEISYVADSRWTSPAQGLFNQAISEGFARSAQTVNLQARGPSRAKYRLDVVVRKFETDYSHNKPVVTIAMDARIIRMSDRTIVGQRYINSDVPVRKNDMSEMVEGYNTATTQAVAALILLTEETVSAQEAETPPPATPDAVKKNTAKQKVEGL